MAIFHDYLRSLGGGEKTILFLAEQFDADLITNDFNPEVLRLAGAEGVRVVNLGPLFDTPPLRQIQASLRFAGARFPGYDLYIFSGNWCHYAAKRHGPNLMYCHTPVRAFYDQRRALMKSLPLWQRGVARIWVEVHSRFDEASMKHMDAVAVNSENVRGRVRKYYDLDSVVVYAPVATDRFRFESIGDYWLSVNRFYPEKRIDMQLEIFRRLPEEKLLIVGDVSGDKMSKKIAAGLRLPSNVRLMGAVGQADLYDLYARCKGLITTAVDEDFGVTPVEAMAAGKCVLAVDEGGYRETVIDGETGWLLPAEVDAFVQKIRSLATEDLMRRKGACIARAANFGQDAFMGRLRSVLDSMMANRKSRR